MQAHKQPDPLQRGYLIIFGEKSNPEAPVFFGWVARNGKNSVTELSARLQYGYPGRLEKLHVFGSTAMEADELRAMFSWSRIGETNWFSRTADVNNCIAAWDDYRRREFEELVAREAREKARPTRKAAAKPTRTSRQRPVKSSSRKIAA